MENWEWNIITKCYNGTWYEHTENPEQRDREEIMEEIFLLDLESGENETL